MRILILGGTRFLGRALAAIALARGHAVTLFHRGLSGPGLFPSAEHLNGDRDGGLGVLEGGSWDAVLDTSGYLPRLVAGSAQVLAARSPHYTFVSSISVYADVSAPGVEEDARVISLPDPAVEEVTGDTYGGLKALCEEQVRRRFAERALIVRPGLIVGPHDTTDRFTWWVDRIARGGDVLVPGSLARTIQVIDVRDLAGWMLDQVERGAAGTFTATGPAGPIAFGRVFEEARRAGGSDARPIEVDEALLLERGVEPWSEMPLWIPAGDAAHAGMLALSIARARAAGLGFRPMAETVRDTLNWVRRERGERPWAAGMTPEREAALLREWRERGA